MKKLLIPLLFLCCLNSFGSIVYFPLTNWNGTTATNRIKVTPVGDTALVDGQYFVVGPAKWLSPTNGSCTNAMNGGNFRMDIDGLSYPLPIFFAVPSNDTNTYNVTNLWISGGSFFNYSPGVRQIIGTNGFVVSPANGMGSVIVDGSTFVPQLFIAAGTNATVVTNGNLRTISSTGGGGANVAAGTNVLAVTNGAVTTLHGLTDTNAVRANAIAALKTNQNNFTWSNHFAGPITFESGFDSGVLGAFNVNADGSGDFATGGIVWDIDGNFGAATFTGSGPGLVGLNATALSAGTVADVRLTGNVALKGSVNVFTQSNSIAGAFTGNAIGLTNAGPGLATNSATATDGQVLKKTGNRLAFATVTGIGDVLAAGDNAFTGSNSMSGPLTFPNTGSPGIFILQGDGDGDLVLTNRGGSNGSFLFSDAGWFSANGPIVSYDYISASNGFYGKFIGDGSALSQGNASTFFSTGTLPGSVIPAFSGAATNAAGSTVLALQDHDHTSHTKGGPISLTGAAFANQGTAATVLHGNASGNPSFGAVRLDTDVTGNLPVANLNGGVNANSATTWFGDGTWKTPSSAAVTGEWHTNGNDAQASGFLGTTNASELRFRENNVQVARFNSTNGIVIGAANDLIGGNFLGTPAGIFAPAGGNTNFNSAGSTILGGTGNQIHTNANAFIGGGSGNKIYVESPGNDANAIVGGIGNKIDTNCGTAFIGGGNGNRVSTNGLSAVIGGGVNNQAAGLNATVPGGNGNRAFGNYSFVAGFQGRANNAGSFVWSDTQGTAVDSAADQFVVNARGGVFLNGKLTSDASGLTNGSPGLATNSATATDGQVLVKRGTNLNLETVPGVGGGGPFTNLSVWANGDYAITAHGGFENTNVSTGWKIVGTNYQFGIIATNTSQSPSNSFQVDTPQQSKAMEVDTNGQAFFAKGATVGSGAGTNTFVAGNLSAYNVNVTNDVNVTNNLRVAGSGSFGDSTFTNAPVYLLSTNTPTSNQTNYSLDFGSKAFTEIFTANTNAKVTFANITVSKPVTLLINAITSTVNCSVSFPANVVTNSGLVLTVTNGTARFFNFQAFNGTDSTNVFVTGGDVYRR